MQKYGDEIAATEIEANGSVKNACLRYVLAIPLFPRSQNIVSDVDN